VLVNVSLVLGQLTKNPNFPKNKIDSTLNVGEEHTPHWLEDAFGIRLSSCINPASR